MGRRERKGRGRKVELIWEKCREAAGRARADASAICSGQGRVTKPGDTGIVTAGGELGTALPAYFSRQKLLTYFVVAVIENSPWSRSNAPVLRDALPEFKRFYEN